MTGNAPDLPRLRRRRPPSTARCSTSTTRTASASSASAADDETLALRHARQQRRAPLRRDLRQPRARRRLLEGLLVAAGLHRLPDRGQGPAQGRRAAVPVLRARRRSPRWPPCSPASTSTSAAATSCAARCARLHRPRARLPATASASHTPNRSGFPIIEIPLARPPAHRRGRPLAVRPRRLRDARRLPARAQGRGRLPRPAHGGQHRRRGRHADRGARGAGRARRARSCAPTTADRIDWAA